MISNDDRSQLADAANGLGLPELVRALTDSVDIDIAWEKAKSANGGVDPTDEQLAAVRGEMLEASCRLLAERPKLREKLIDVRRSYAQVLDETSKDEIIDAGFSRDATDRAQATIDSWQAYVAEHKDDIDALQILYSRPYGKRLTLKTIKELASAIGRPPYNWTPERLWQAYEALEASQSPQDGKRADIHEVAPRRPLATRRVVDDDAQQPATRRAEPTEPTGSASAIHQCEVRRRERTRRNDRSFGPRPGSALALWPIPAANGEHDVIGRL